MATIFSKIIAGEIPSYKIAEDENHYAFLDINPVVKGHTLVVPKVEVDKLFDLSDPIYLDLMQFAKTVSHALKASFDCNRIGMTVIGLEVPHAHVHLMPINNLRDMDFTRPKVSLTNEDFEKICLTISSNM